VSLPELSQSPVDPAFVQNPYPFYDRARAEGAFFHWKEYGFPCAAGYKTVDTLLRNRCFGREAPAGFGPEQPAHLDAFYHIEKNSMLELEPPAHTRLRGLVIRAFTSRRIVAMAPEITALAHTLIDAMKSDTDLLPAFAEKIPVIVIARFLGVPEEMADQLLCWSHDMVAMYQARKSREIEDRAVAASAEFSAFIREHVNRRRGTPGDDLITHLIAAEEDGERLSTDELISTCILLLNAGHEATVHSIGNGVKTVLESGLPVEELFRTDITAQAAIEETLRFDPPLHMFTRYALEDMEVSGHEFKTGDTIGLLLAAANRDPSRFENPDNFDPDRTEVGNLSFGGGLHFCVGAPLARMEMSIALPVLFERLPNLRLSDPTVYADRYHFHGLEALQVSF